MALDARGETVVRFMSALRNASRMGTYVETVVAMFASGAWRDYHTAVSHDRWRAHEFDYFLITCEADYHDVARLLTWTRVETVAAIAVAMTEPFGPHRRRLDKAAQAWGAPAGVSLFDLAQHHGWLRRGVKTPTLLAAPVSSYMRTLAKEAKEAPPAGRGRAEFYRTRTLDLPAARRCALDAEAARLRRRYSADELRYLRERLGHRGAGRPRLNGPVSGKTIRQRRWRERLQLN
jgi:hypothetical protein